MQVFINLFKEYLSGDTILDKMGGNSDKSLEKIVFVQGCSTSAPCESQLCHSFQTRQKEEKGWKGSWERCRFCVCPHKKVGPKKVLKWLNWWHWHSNQGFCQTYLCLQERPLGVWSHEQNAPSGPRLFHPGKKGLKVSLKILQYLISRRWTFWRSTSDIPYLWLSRTTPVGQKVKSPLVFVHSSPVRIFWTDFFAKNVNFMLLVCKQIVKMNDTVL